MSKIKLTEKEQEQFDIALNQNHRNNYEDNMKSLDAQQALTESLIERKAIPENRIKYFIERDYQHGMTKLSRKEVFESNGVKGTKIYKNPHFLKYLEFFINGADISQDIYEISVTAFKSTPYQDDSILKIYEYLKFRQYIPKDRNSRKKFANEIFKLTADLGFEASNCIYIRKKIMS